jgi:hypothetical protein
VRCLTSTRLPASTHERLDQEVPLRLQPGGCGAEGSALSLGAEHSEERVEGGEDQPERARRKICRHVADRDGDRVTAGFPLEPRGHRR